MTGLSGGRRAGQQLLPPRADTVRSPIDYLPLRAPEMASPGWQLLLLPLMLAPYPLIWLLDLPRTERMLAAGQFTVVICDFALIATAALLLGEWRLSRSQGTAGFAAAITFVAIQDLPYMVLAMHSEKYAGYSYRTVSAHLVIAAVVLACAARAAGYGPPTRLNPVLTGGIIGVAFVIVRIAFDEAGMGGVLERTSPVDGAVAVIIVAIVVLSMVITVRGRTMPRWVRWQVATAILLYAGARLAATYADAGTPPVAGVVATVACSVILVGAAGRLLRQTLTDHSRRLAALTHRAAEADAEMRHGREVAHEMTATVSGIVAATSLLAADSRQISGPHRTSLQQMVNSEMARLGRILADRASDPVEKMSVDEVIEPLVVAQRALGHAVDWRPSGLIAIGRRDALAEVANILLTNGVHHGGGTTVTIGAELAGDRVEIEVVDSGPGVPAALRERLFEWGTRGPSSNGQGIGLQLARRLMHEAGGSLELAPRSELHTGARFIASLPVAVLDPTNHPRGEAAPTSRRPSDTAATTTHQGETDDHDQHAHRDSDRDRRGPRPVRRVAGTQS